MALTVRFGVTQKGKRKLIDEHGYSYVFNCKNSSGLREYWKCTNRDCNGRFAYCVETGTGRVSVPHVEGELNQLEVAKDAAIDRLRELTLEAGEGAKAIDIVRKLFKELPPETRAVMPDEDKLTQRVRRWAKVGGVELVRATFVDYLVEDGLDDIPPQSEVSKGDSSVLSKEKTVSSSDSLQENKVPELIFLKGRSGEKHRVMIDGNLYFWTRDLGKGVDMYICQDTRTGCRVTARINLEQKHYEIRGTHDHQGSGLSIVRPKKRPSRALQLVDEEGRDLGNVPIENIFTAGESNVGFNFHNEDALKDAAHSTSAVPRKSKTRNFQCDQIISEASRVPIDENCHDDASPPLTPDDFADVNVEIRHSESSVEKVALTSTLLTSSSCETSSLHEPKKNAIKSGERCFVCGDELILSETLLSSKETFRKACCYLNVRSATEWFPKKPSDLFYCFCESCTIHITRIHDLYRKVEEIQSQIFKKVEYVEKRIADAEIIDNWMADAPITSAQRFEGFRKQVLINYRNKLKLRREIREGKKLGLNFIEIQPATSVHMFANDPSETDAFRKLKSKNAKNITLDTGSQSKGLSKRARGRPKSKKKMNDSVTPSFETSSLVENTTTHDANNFVESDAAGFPQCDDDAMSTVSEKEIKFWEDDPSKLHVNKDSSDDADMKASKRSTLVGKNRCKRTKKGRGANSSKGALALPLVSRPKTLADRIAEAKAAAKARLIQNPNASKTKEVPSPVKTKQTESRTQKRKHHSGKFEYPDAILKKDGRIFMSEIEIIKNAPGALKRRPFSISFTCGACGKIIQTFWRMRQHICGHHLDMYKCFCGKKFSEPLSLFRHNKSKHTDKPCLWRPCPVCERPLKGDNRSMRHHIWSHLGEEEKNDPKYKSFCPFSKRDPNRIKATEGLQTFMCSFCSNTFYRIDSLQKHELTHTSDDSAPPPAVTVQCQYCGKLFTSKKGLQRHSNRCGENEEAAAKAASVVSFPCPQCPVRFKNRSTRSKHIEKFHCNLNYNLKDLPFSCPKCPRCFSTRSGFKTHKRICIEGQMSPSFKHGRYRVVGVSSSKASKISSSKKGNKSKDDMTHPSEESSHSPHTNIYENVGVGGGGSTSREPSAGLLLNYQHSLFGNYLDPHGNAYQPYQRQ